MRITYTGREVIKRAMLDFIKDAAAVIGFILSAAALLTLIIKPLRGRVAKALKLKALLDSQLLDEETRRTEARLNREALKCLLRDDIVRLYYKRLPEKKLHAYELENITALYDTYILFGGNSFVREIYRKMSTEWQIEK